MARTKFFNHKTGKWEYADSAFSSGGTVTDEQVVSVVADCIEQASATNNEIIDLLVENDMLPGIIDADGSILTDENNNILSWY